MKTFDINVEINVVSIGDIFRVWTLLGGDTVCTMLSVSSS